MLIQSLESANDKLLLNVELPTFEYPVVFNEREFEVPPTLPPNASVVRKVVQLVTHL